MTREVQRELERKLPQYVLDYLNEEFKKKEEQIERIRELENKTRELLNEISKRDQTLWEAFKTIGYDSNSQRNFQNAVPGFKFYGEDQQYRKQYPEFPSYARGNRGGGYEGGRGHYYDEPYFDGRGPIVPNYDKRGYSDQEIYSRMDRDRRDRYDIRDASSSGSSGGGSSSGSQGGSSQGQSQGQGGSQSGGQGGSSSGAAPGQV